MSTLAQQAGTLSPFPGIYALHALLLSVYERIVGQALAEPGYLGDRPSLGLEPWSSGRIEAPAQHGVSRRLV